MSAKAVESTPPPETQQSKPKGVLTKNMKITLVCLTVLAIIALLVVVGTHHAHASQLSKHSALANTKHLSAKSVAHTTTTQATPTRPHTMKLLPAIGLATGFVGLIVVFIGVALSSGDGTTAFLATR